jgi:methylated-DNA-protein-cysteine methyltransferase-like protein
VAKSTRRRGAQRTDDAEARVKAFQRAVYAVIRRIPRGKVATYGQVAELAGGPGAARAVGTYLKISSRAAGLPWQRVIGKRSRGQGRISILDPIGGAMQRAMLEAEGVEVSEAGQISLARHGWLPDESPKRRTARRSRRAARSR